MSLAAQVLLIGAPSLVVFSGDLAQAENRSASDDAEEHIQRGITLRTEGKDAESLPEFERAYALAPTARARAQIGLAELAVGHYEKAEADLKEALNARGDKWIAKQRALLEKTLEAVRDKLGTLEVSGQPAGATVEVDGKDVGKLPCSLRVHTGEIALRVKAPGFLAILRTAQVDARSLTKEEFALVRIGGEAGSAARQAEPPGASAVSVASGRPFQSPPAADSGSGLRVAGVALAAAGVASLGTGTFFGLRAKSLRDDLTRAAVFDPAKDQSMQTSRTMEYVFLASGGALLAGGGLLYWLGSRDPAYEERPLAHAQVVPLASQTSFVLALTGGW